MNTEGWNKLSANLVTSSMWSQQNSDTRVVWITLLAMANQWGEVCSSIPGLARLANVPLEACEAALNAFLSPDPYSRSKDNEGRRIKEIKGGWLLLNHAKYREIRSKEDRRIYKAKKEAERRARLKAEKAECPRVDSRVDKRGQNGPIQSTDTDTDISIPLCSSNTISVSTPPPTSAQSNKFDFKKWEKEAAKNATPPKQVDKLSPEEFDRNSDGDILNHPPLAKAQEYFLRVSDYDKTEIRLAYCQFEAAAPNGIWMWGRRPVCDWKTAMESRMMENRKKTERPGERAAETLLEKAIRNL